MRDEGLYMSRRPSARQSRFYRNTAPRERAERVELVGAGANVRHGAEVEIEVADIGSVGTDIRLLAYHDVVDQARSSCVVRREPRHSCASHILLKSLQQRHEIPNGEDVI